MVVRSNEEERKILLLLLLLRRRVDIWVSVETHRPHHHHQHSTAPELDIVSGDNSSVSRGEVVNTDRQTDRQTGRDSTQQQQSLFAGGWLVGNGWQWWWFTRKNKVEVGGGCVSVSLSQRRGERKMMSEKQERARSKVEH